MRTPSAVDTAVLASIALFTALRLALAAVLGLGVDEAYTLSVAHDLQLSYYDHPPLQYWIAHLFMPLLGDGRAARVPFIGLFAVSSWLLYRLTQLLFGAKAGVAAVLALNCSAFFTFAGGWVLPDGPLMLALLAASLVLARHFFAPRTSSVGARGAWLLAGLWLGLAALAKYHALLFAIGLLVFLASVPYRRRELRHAAPWFAALLALLIATPVVVWNIQHEWISVGYQLGRGRFGGQLHPEYVLANLIGQAFWILPWIFVPLLIAAWRASCAGRTAERSWYCLCLALPTVAVFTLVPLWGSLGLPHWQMPGWLMLYPVLGEYAVRSLEAVRLRRWAFAYVIAIVLFGTVLAGHAVTGFGRILAPQLFAHGDPTLATFEWSQLPGELRARGWLQPGVFLITTNWMYAGRVDEAFHHTVPVVVFGGNPKQFGLRYDAADLLGRDALVLGPADSMTGIADHLQPYFQSVHELAPFALGRSGMPEIPLRLMRARCLLEPLPSSYRQPSSAALAGPEQHRCLGRDLDYSDDSRRPR
jgi:4-amino-4-deoxy-L-arabinose transferase-like glycosyltransferase